MCILECLKIGMLRHCLQPRNMWTFTSWVQPVTKYNSPCCVFDKPALCWVSPSRFQWLLPQLYLHGKMCFCCSQNLPVSGVCPMGKKNQGSSVCWAVNGINSNGMQLNVRNVQREGLRGESNRFRKLFLQPYFGWVGFSCFCLVLSDKIFWASWNLKWEGSWSLTLLLFSHSFSLVVLCHKERMIEAWFAHRGVRVWWCPLAKLLLGPWPRMTKMGIRETECT